MPCWRLNRAHLTPIPLTAIRIPLTLIRTLIQTLIPIHQTQEILVDTNLRAEFGETTHVLHPLDHPVVRHLLAVMMMIGDETETQTNTGRVDHPVDEITAQRDGIHVAHDLLPGHLHHPLDLVARLHALKAHPQDARTAAAEEMTTIRDVGTAMDGEKSLGTGTTTVNETANAGGMTVLCLVKDMEAAIHVVDMFWLLHA